MSKKSSKLVYQEFGQSSDNKALERGTPDLPPNQQNIRIQATKAGRKGKIVTVISGFQHNDSALSQLLKKLKTQCGSGGTLKENSLEIQGDHRQKLLQLLTELGYKVKISGG